jgi:hypothetical protein
MTVDTTALTDAVTTFITQVFNYIPLGLAIVGIPSAIGVGLLFGGRIVGFVKSALLGSGK